MRTAILSDIHGNDVAFEAVASDMKKSGVNNIIFLGDLVAMGPQPREVYDRLMQLNILTLIKGNTDAWLDDAMINVIPSSEKEIRLLAYYDYMTHHLTGDEMDCIIDFKVKDTIHLGRYEVQCMHERSVLTDVTSTVILSGHTHGCHDYTSNAYRLLNPGAVGMCNEGNDKRASYMIIDTTYGFHVEQRFVEYDSDRLLDIARQRAFPNMADYELRLTQKES